MNNTEQNYEAKELKKGKNPTRFFNLIKKRLSLISPSIYIYLFIIQLVLLIIGLVPPTLSRFFVDEVIGQKLYDWKDFFLLSLAIIIAMECISITIRGLATNRLTKNLSTLFSVKYLDHLFKILYHFFSQHSGGEIVNRINLNIIIADFITTNLSVLTINTLLIFIYAIVMFQYDTLITFIGIIAGIANALIFIYISRSRRNDYNRIETEVIKSISTSIDSLKNMEFIKSTCSESFCFARVMGNKIRNINNYQSIYLKDIWLISISGLFTQLAMTLLLIVGSWHVMEGVLSVGMLLALQILMAGFLAPINQVMDVSMKIQSLSVDMLQIDEVLKIPVDPLLTNTKTNNLSKKLKGKLEFDHVTFGFNSMDEPFFKDLTFTIEPNQIVAFVGRSGSGKSTMMKLICGLFIPWSGKILYDGLPITELSREEIKNSIAWVDKDPLIFSGTISDNLTLWDRTVSDQKMEIAAKKASIYGVIQARNQGFDTIIADEGSNLSYGEKQRLEIARAFLLNPAILLLDEATSALDSQSESEIFQNIKNSQCTCVMVSHSLNTVKNCDMIFVLDNGMLVQQGTHDQLSSIPGIYQKLMQYDES